MPAKAKQPAKQLTKRPAKRTTKRQQAEPDRQSRGETIPLMGILTWTDLRKEPLAFVLDVPYDSDSESAEVRIMVRLRSVASIELRPVRRPLSDVDGQVADAVRLANS
jgi:hypothetical protein